MVKYRIKIWIKFCNRNRVYMSHIEAAHTLLVLSKPSTHCGTGLVHSFVGPIPSDHSNQKDTKIPLILQIFNNKPRGMALAASSMVTTAVAVGRLSFSD